MKRRRPTATRDPRPSSLGFAAYLGNLGRHRRKGGKDLDDGGVPVEPNRPSTLSGGAAAELEFDD